MQKEERRKLYIGLDESNHGRYPEVIVAVSSLIRSDAAVSRISGRERMDEDELARFLRNNQRDYCYICAGKGELAKNKNPLVESAPCLVDELLKRIDEPVDGIDIMLDGEVRRNEIFELSTNLRKLKRAREFSAAALEVYPKSKKAEYNYTKLLVAADTLANLLFRRQSFIEKIKAEERRIDLR